MNFICLVRHTHALPLYCFVVIPRSSFCFHFFLSSLIQMRSITCAHDSQKGKLDRRLINCQFAPIIQEPPPFVWSVYALLVRFSFRAVSLVFYKTFIRRLSRRDSLGGCIYFSLDRLYSFAFLDRRGSLLLTGFSIRVGDIGVWEDN